MSNPLSEAHKALCHVIIRQQSLNDVFERFQITEALTKQICFGVCRWYFQLSHILNSLIQKPLKAKDRDVEVLMLIGLYQLQHLSTPAHASVNNTVLMVKALKKPWAKGLVNAVLRNFQRQQEALMGELAGNPEFTSAHPAWFLEAISHYPHDEQQQIINANNQQAPMHLRVNLAAQSREAYLALLEAEGVSARVCHKVPSAITLDKAVNVSQLPGFNDGMASVQDKAGQCAASLLNVAPGQRVLDACAAPGGKTGHLLECCPDIVLTALDNMASRLEKVQSNLTRLGLSATLVCGDAADPESWFDGQLFDRILLDAPCSATGVIRRHPDIKLLRQSDHIKESAEKQYAILRSLWSLLAPGGILIYATCSIMPQENDQVIERFLTTSPNAKIMAIDVPWGTVTEYGRQILPGEDQMDGFYYARLVKKAT